MKKFVESDAFKAMNVGLALDEGKACISSIFVYVKTR